MPLFRRSSDASAPEPVSTDPVEEHQVPVAQQAKGRPTPKRRDAEAARRAKPPQGRKEARARMREEKAKERAELMVALREGDERRYPARDRGPARHIARNWVDGRRGVGDYFWPAVIAAIIMIVLPVPQVQAWSSVLLIGFYVVLMTDTAWSLTGLSKVLKDKVPEQAHRKGALPYAFGRSLQSRKRRLPAVQVERGWTKQARRGQIDPLK
ncbi:MAG: DUF3043 domain-containing protein [Actinomycetota bacterium]|nr:DUF3043 domain-containing protein [Actinomycetota bacterium]MDH4353698.1 DUF3043 domain-containing protein [Actinomycetota bacterium]